MSNKILVVREANMGIFCGSWNALGLLENIK
jgi:hypothetical protein